MKPAASVALLALLVAAAPAPAAEPTIELTPFAAYRFGGGFDDAATGAGSSLDSAASFGAVVSFRVGFGSFLELAYSRQDSAVGTPPWAGPPGTIDVKVEYLTGGGLYEFSMDDLRPFLALSAGVTRFSSDDAEVGSDTRLALGLSGGFKYTITRNLRLRLEGRLWMTVTESGSAALCQGGSCLLVFGASGFYQFEVLGGVTLAF